MILSRSGNILCDVRLAVLKRPDGTHVRFFSTSEGVSTYLKAHPDQEFVLDEAAGGSGQFLQHSDGNYGPEYGDVFLGAIKYDSRRQTLVFS